MTVEPQPSGPIEVFYSYAHDDETLRDELVKHLANLRRQGVITNWYDRDISAGKEWNDEIKTHLDDARVILLLISPDFMDSDYCNNVEVNRAMERHEAGEARVIPVILRPVDWDGAPFSKLQALPTDVRPITSWSNLDEAFLDVTKGIRKAIQELSGPSASIPAIPDIPRPPRVGFVSRRDKDGHDIVERLREELAPHKNQLVALWGAGGVGKTTLAAEAARSLAETSGQRIIWVTADGRANFAFTTLLDDIAEQLGRTDLRPLAPEPKAEALRPIIAAAPTLIILDNFETISPEEELLCKNFLSQRVRCPALITTRRRIDDAYLLTLAAMSPDEASEYLERLITQTHDPDIYAEVDRNRILREAEFNPLIVQWIVAQIDLAQDPEEVLGDLAHGEGDAAERVFDRSFNLPQMAEGGRAVLLALSLFTPSATRLSLASVAGMSKDKDKKKFKKAQQTLASLWLIKGLNENRRFTIEGLTRSLAGTQLLKDSHVAEFRQRFVTHFLNYTKAHAQPTPENFDALESEKDNVLGMADVAFEMGDWSSVMKIAAILADPARGMLSLRGYWDEAIRRGEQAVVAAQTAGDEWAVTQFAGNLATIRMGRGEYNEAKRTYQQVLAAFRKLGSDANVAVALNQLGTLAQNQGELAEARRLYGESLEIKKKLDNQSGIAITLHNLATIAQNQGDLAEAYRLYDESLEINKKLGDLSGIAGTLHELGRLAQNQGDLAEAYRLYGESLEIERKLGDLSGIATTLHELGRLAQAQSELAEARRLYGESLEIKKKLGDLSGIAITLHNLAVIAQDQGDLAEAYRLYGESLEIERKLGDQSGIATTSHQLGILTAIEGNGEEAVRLMREALAIWEKLKSPNAEIARRNLKRLGAEAS